MDLRWIGVFPSESMRFTKGKVFKEQHLGKISFGRIVKEMCKDFKIWDSGFQKYMTAHSLRATMTSLLIETGHGNAIVILRMGHSDTYTLSQYHN